MFRHLSQAKHYSPLGFNLQYKCHTKISLIINRFKFIRKYIAMKHVTTHAFVNQI